MMATKARRAHRLYQPQETSAVLSIVAIKRLQCLIQATSENNGIVGRSKRMSTATSGRFAELGIRTSASERATQSSLTLWKHQKKKKKIMQRGNRCWMDGMQKKAAWGVDGSRCGRSGRNVITRSQVFNVTSRYAGRGIVFARKTNQYAWQWWPARDRGRVRPDQ